MGLHRNPLDAEYDGFSATFLGLLEADLYGWRSATVRSPARDPVDERGLSYHERSVQNSLYYVLNSTGAEGPRGGRWVKNPDYSLRIRWGAPLYEGNVLQRLFRGGRRRRVLAAQLVSARAAPQWYRRQPGEALYTVTEAEQSQNLQLR